jgi:Cysteine rich repeat
MTGFHRALAIGILSLAFASSSTRAEGKEGKGPCAGDVEKFCKGVKPGGGRILRCLKEHDADLSAACKERGAEMKGAVREISAACKGDVEKLCKDVKPGGGRILACLKKQSDQVSDQCKGELAEKRKGGG